VALPGVYPGSISGSTRIKFELTRASHVHLDIYNIMGQKVATVVDVPMNAGSHTVSYNGSVHARGV
jgi:hypothetical protein